MSKNKSKVSEARPEEKPKRIRTLILLAAAVGMGVQFMRMDQSKRRFILHLAKQVPYLPGRYYA